MCTVYGHLMLFCASDQGSAIRLFYLSERKGTVIANHEQEPGTQKPQQIQI